MQLVLVCIFSATFLTLLADAKASSTELQEGLRKLLVSRSQEDDVEGDLGNDLSRRDLGRKRRKKKERRALKLRPNHPVCSEIAEGWWTQRDAYKELDEYFSELDDLCRAYDGDALACASREARDAYAGMPEDVLHASCNMLGAGSEKCISNPCNQLNDGECTLQQTAGRCVWLTSSQVKAANEYLESIGSPAVYDGHGCYNNVCHSNAAGRGRISDATCASFSVPGIMDCTYCKGTRRYSRFRNLGIGCQMTVSETTAECAPVNNENIEKSSIFIKNGAKRRCQCSATYGACAQKVALTSRDGSPSYRRRFP